MTAPAPQSKPTAVEGSQPGTSEAPTADDFAALREIEEAWLSRELSRAIKNLAYPVGMGKAPQTYHMDAAARSLFDRYAKMIEMAHAARDATLQARVEELTKALRECQSAFRGYVITDPAEYPDVLASFWKEIRRMDEASRRALSISLEQSGTGK